MMAKRKKATHPGPKLKQTGRTPEPAAAELLLEIGVEELPYQFVLPALSKLEEQANFHFGSHRLSCRSTKTYGTPRRLVLVVEGLKTHQDPCTTEIIGPSKKVAFDHSGQPTKAAIMFAARMDVPVESLHVKHLPEKGEYVVAVKEDKGRPTLTILCETLPTLIEDLSFPKAMKWNETGVRFARPIRWVVAIYGGSVVPLEVAGVAASNQTTGHRVVGGGKWVRVKDAASYLGALERQGAIVDPQRRRKLIEEQIDEICRKAGFQLNDDDALLDQAVYSTELPTSIIGSFKDAYLDVPEEILITSMKEHQGFFSLRHKETGKLVPHFIAVANNRVKDMSLIREGNERVLAARLADAKFFFDEDRKVRLEERSKKLAGVTFHQKLGTMAHKQERVRTLADFLAAHLAPGHDELRQTCDRAAALSKADLLTGIVGEFPELQGVMGGVYALHDGESAAVAKAIREQYLPKAIEGELPSTLAGKVLSLADRLDSLAAFFHVGIVPTGSEDPFALRRHATAIVRIVLEGSLRIDLGTCIEHAMDIVKKGGFLGVPDVAQQGRRRITEFLFERMRHYCRVVHLLRDDVIEAVLTAAHDTPLDLVDLVQKMKALEAVTRKPEFDSLIIGFKRAHRLVEKEQWTREPIEVTRFQHVAESVLHNAVTEERARIQTSVEAGDYGLALEALVRLKPAIDAFFTAVMVNVEDKAVRGNRLSLLKDVDELFMSFADFSRIVVQGN